jgi:peptidoglycan hydrolase CwlO-like protein
MNKIVLLVIFLISFYSYSQDYPKIELNEKGEKVVVFTLAQAQSIDNNLEVLELMKVARVKCDSLNISYIKVIDEQKKQIVKLEKLNSELNNQIVDKDKQIVNLNEQNKNLNGSVESCEKENDNKDKEIEGLKKDIKKVKWKSLGSGFVVGVVATLITIISLK